ncbi:Lipase 4 [Cytospora mali]|uniref:Patatin-like phospholipase domain-containing protein n=1 Tax=Cytospora mali TaxID=578113 RepID=A0A194W3Q6_CYTMA|nr:Lipase 4 [Valsa mali]
MSDLFHILPSVSLGQVSSSPTTNTQNDARATALKKCSSGTSPVHSLSRFIKGANGFLSSRSDGKPGLEHEETCGPEQRKQILALRMRNATSVSQWTTAAEELDLLEGNQAWKSEENGVNGLYRPDIIRDRMRELDEARINCDIRRMVHLVRTALSRELGNMGEIDLYRHSYIGTKDLIEQYVQSAVATIEDLVEKSGYPGALPDDLDHNDILEAFLQARQSFGRSALLLSGGGTFGMMHAGVLKAMFEADILPRIISGASAGSIVCAVFCTTTTDQVPEVIKQFPYGDLAVFEEGEKEESVLTHVKRLLTEGSWSDIKHLTRVMRGLLGDITFQEAYNRTRKICNISVSTESIYELPRLLNYITAPNVMIWSAVAASCSVPFVFNAAPLLVKDPQTGEHMPWNPTPQRWVDGSVDNDLPMTRLAEMFNVNHFIVSQVNPHVVPFLAKDDRLYPEHDDARSGIFSASHNSTMTATLTTLAKDEVLHRLHFLAELGILPTAVTKLRSVLSQKYSGDITILPEPNVQDLTRVLKNPTVDFMERATLAGERATWPKLSRIRDRCAVELAIDRSIQILRARCLFSQSQVNLRRLASEVEALCINTSFDHGLRTTDASGPITVGLPPLSSPIAEKVRPRQQRRSSGSSIQILARHRRHLLDIEDSLADDDGKAGDHKELSLRRGGSSLSLSADRRASKPKLKRSLKALSNSGPMSSPFPAHVSGTDNDSSDFDFSRPLEPQEMTSGPARSPAAVSRSFPRPKADSSRRVDVTSPTTGGSDASNLHTSDGEVDSRTGDNTSDPEPYSQAWGPAEANMPHKGSRSDDSAYDTEIATTEDENKRASSPFGAALADDEQDTTDGGGLWD